MQGWQIFATISFFVSRLFFYYPCEHPVAYHLGYVDSRFGLSPSAAQQDINTAANVWGQQYFQLDPASSLTINFVYDQRQSLATQINTSQDQITSNEAALAAQIKAFNAKAKSLDQQIADFNAEIVSWKRQGGIPDEATFNQLHDRQQQLQSTGQSLQLEAASLNAAAKKFNLQVDQLNGTIDSFNSLLAQKPEEGLYNSAENRIDIYFVNTKSELVHTLAHEFGHALGLNHVDNPKGIMYSYSSQTLSPSSEDQAELTLACTRISRFKILSQLLTNKLRGNIE